LRTSATVFVQGLGEPLFALRTFLGQRAHEPGLAHGLLRYLQAPQSSALHVQVAHPACLLSEPSQKLEQLLIVAAAPLTQI
jgi:hypothetical protein